MERDQANRLQPEARALRLWRRSGPIVFVLVVAAGLWVWFDNEEALIAWKSELEPVSYFALLTVAGTVGVPTVPFYILAGLVFGPWVALTGAALSVLGYQTLCYLIAHGPLRRWSDRLRLLVERQTAEGWLHSPVARIVLVRVSPGLPTALKNYVAASMGASLPVYLSVSWPIAFLGVAAVVLLGDSIATGQPLEALLAFALLLPVVWLGFRFRRARGGRLDLGANHSTPSGGSVGTLLLSLRAWRARLFPIDRR